ncbi:amidohydrolase family protein [Parasphingorhabdus sp.]|uniref:amidohydrolase family protein n=1 Tax=Parasphingorhabdus sp. TaxID=2709688 RepID=UPI0032647AB1
MMLNLFRSFTVFFVFALAACANLPDNPANESSGQIVITNVTAIDAVNGVRANVDILIDGEQISAVDQDLSASTHSGAKRIDGTGKYLIPGLWDAHVHLAYHPDIGHEVFFPLSLAHGITYLRDTGGHLDKLAEARAISASDAIAPDLYVSGPLVDGKNRVYAGQSAGTPDLSVGVANEAQAIAQVDKLAAQGVDFIKAYEMLSPTALKAVATRAKYHNLPVTGHSPLSMTVRQSIMAGMKDMQHLRNLEMDCAVDPQSLLAERQEKIAENKEKYGGKLRSSLHRLQRAKAVAAKNEAVCNELIAVMKKSGVSQTPTLVISRFLSRKLYAEKRWQDTYAWMPKSIAKGWLERSVGFADREPTASDIAYDKWLLAMVSSLDKAGISILAGTDSPIAFTTPGISLHEELAMLVEAGLTPMEAIGTATIEPAKFLNLQDKQGSISPSRKADLVLLNADPLSDIRNLIAIDAVFKDGRYLDRNRLKQMRDAPSKLD